jgi:hypothetical protein
MGASAAGDAQEQAYLYKAQVARNNAVIERRNADMVALQGEQVAANKGLQVKANIGGQKAAYSAGGIDSTTGSAAKVQEATRKIGMQDVSTIRSNAAKEAYGHLVQASNDEAGAVMDTASASSAKQAGEINMLSTLLSGVSTAGDKYARFQKTSGFKLG